MQNTIKFTNFDMDNMVVNDIEMDVNIPPPNILNKGLTQIDIDKNLNISED